jgi:hypothetical protein
MEWEQRSSVVKQNILKLWMIDNNDLRGAIGELEYLDLRWHRSGKQAPQATSCQRHDDRGHPNDQWSSILFSNVTATDV